MFCNNCGEELDEGTKFCSSCGKAATASEENRASEDTHDSKPTLVLKPKFIPKEQFLKSIFISATGVLAGALFIGVIPALIIWEASESVPLTAIPPLLSAFLFLIVIPWLCYTRNKKAYDNGEYRFFKNRVEYEIGWLSLNTKTIRYEHIVKTEMRKGFFQRKFNVGNICLIYAPTQVFGSEGMLRFSLKDIENPDEVYDMVQKVIGK